LVCNVVIPRSSARRPGDPRRLLTAKRAHATATRHAAKTLQKYNSAGRYLFELCQVLGLKYDTFGALPENGGISVAEEDVALELLAVYAAHYPRVAGSAHNTGAYGGGVVTGARHDVWKRHHRDVGTPTARNYGLQTVLRSLEREFPSVVRPERLPVLQVALRAVLATLDLTDPLHRVYAALWTMQWQGVCRCGDLLRHEYLNPCQRGDPFWESHRGRVQLEAVTLPAHPEIRVRATVELAPGKKDPLGKRRLCQYFLVDPSPAALSGGRYLAQMLLHDPLRPGETAGHSPLFRKPGTNDEIDYDSVKTAFKHHLRLAGYPELATGLHSLRKEGGTAANDLAGSFVSGALGHWKSKRSLDYFFSMRNSTEATMLSMGRGDAGPLADASGPALHRLRLRR
jgi:hypothetical protein